MRLIGSAKPGSAGLTTTATYTSRPDKPADDEVGAKKGGWPYTGGKSFLAPALTIKNREGADLIGGREDFPGQEKIPSIRSMHHRGQCQSA